VEAWNEKNFALQFRKANSPQTKEKCMKKLIKIIGIAIGVIIVYLRIVDASLE